MSQVRVKLSLRAQKQVKEIQRWWQGNRPKAPKLFREELGHAIDALALSPLQGVPYLEPEVPGLRRLLLMRTSYHLYYSIRDEGSLVVIEAVWHAARGQGPDLG